METSTLVGHFVILVVQLAGLYYQWRREERWHRWKVEEEQKRRPKL